MLKMFASVYLSVFNNILSFSSYISEESKILPLEETLKSCNRNGGLIPNILSLYSCYIFFLQMKLNHPFYFFLL